jgi:hypothetical protein
VLLIEQYIDIIQIVVNRKSRMIVMIQGRVVKYNTAAETNKWYHPALQKNEMRKGKDTVAGNKARH